MSRLSEPGSTSKEADEILEKGSSEISVNEHLRREYRILTRGGQFIVRADCAEHAADVFKMGIRLTRMQGTEENKAVRQVIAITLACIFGKPWDERPLPQYLLDHDYRGKLTFGVMDATRTLMMCTHHHTERRPFIWREPFEVLANAIPGKGYDGLHDFIVRELPKQESLARSLNQLLKPDSSG